MKRTLQIFFVALSVCLAFSSAPASADTAGDLAKIEAYLKRAQVNLDTVDQSIGQRTTPPKGSAAKLAKSRLDQAYADLAAAGKIVSALPAEGDGAAATTAKYKAAAALYTKLANILSGGEKPAEPKPEAKDGEVKLGYPHADNFKNTQFTFRNKVLAPSNQLVELHAKLKPVKDQLSINHRTTAQALAIITEARRQAGFVEEGLGKVPANGQGVAAAKDDLAKALESLKGSEEYFGALHKELMAMIDPAKFPKFEADRTRLKGLASDYGAQWVFVSDRARAAELFQQRKAAQEELVRIAQAYQRLMQQQTEMGKSIETVGNSALGSFKKFDAKIEEEKKALPTAIKGHLAEAEKFGEVAVKNQKPLWFTGGIPQRMGWAEDKLALLMVIDPEGGKAVAEQAAATKAKLKVQAEQLKALIIRENRVPPNSYGGEDSDAVIKVAKSAWAVQQADAKILAVTISTDAWVRTTKWTYSNGTWYFSDRSRLQVRLIVADHENPEQAIDRPVTIFKDHQNEDKMIGVPLRSFDEALQPSEYYLIKNVK